MEDNGFLSNIGNETLKFYVPKDSKTEKTVRGLYGDKNNVIIPHIPVRSINFIIFIMCFFKIKSFTSFYFNNSPRIHKTSPAFSPIASWSASNL